MRESPTSAEAAGSIERRWRTGLLEKRRSQEARKRNREHVRSFPRNLVQGYALYGYLHRLLRLLRLEGHGRRNYLSPKMRRQEVVLERLPAAFDGLRVLHLSDLHFDLAPELLDITIAQITQVEYDLCLLTGDFRDSLRPEGDVGITHTLSLIQQLHGPVFGSLGNHDLASDIPRLESGKMRLLINEHSYIERNGERLYLAGVDDTSYMDGHDFEAAFEGIPQDACVLLLAHAPDCALQAEKHGADFMLSGHTHGGQFCLPGGIPLVSHCDCPRRMISGAWKQGRLQGYTSNGTGACRIPARYFCRGEIVVHTLRSGKLGRNLS